MEQILIFRKTINGGKTAGYYDLLEAEFAFEYRGFRFMIHQFGDRWRVSDALIGAGIATEYDPDLVISKALLIIMNNFDKYLVKCKDELKKRRLNNSKWRYTYVWGEGEREVNRVI